jgi:glycosyltransferase involved in cell wall biosynthesis
MKIAILAPVAWRTPPRHYGPWEQVASLLTEELVKAGHEVTLFATADSVTNAELRSIVAKGYEEDETADPKVVECLHISNCFEQAGEFDIIHNHFDFLPLTYTKLVATPVITTIHGFSSEKIVPVYKKYNAANRYISISNADRNPSLDYLATVYHGIDIDRFTYRKKPEGGYLLFFGRIHHDKGTAEAIEIARRTDRKLILAGIIQDEHYFNEKVKPFLEEGKVEYVGSADPQKRDEILGNADALLHPINFDEPFGLSVVESLACGTPVIAFNRGSMPEILSHGFSGFLVNRIDEAVESIPSLPDIDRENCRKTVESRFTARVMAEAYMSAYTAVLAG